MATINANGLDTGTNPFSGISMNSTPSSGQQQQQGFSWTPQTTQGDWLAYLNSQAGAAPPPTTFSIPGSNVGAPTQAIGNSAGGATIPGGPLMSGGGNTTGTPVGSSAPAPAPVPFSGLDTYNATTGGFQGTNPAATAASYAGLLGSLMTSSPFITNQTPEFQAQQNAQILAGLPRDLAGNFLIDPAVAGVTTPQTAAAALQMAALHPNDPTVQGLSAQQIIDKFSGPNVSANGPLLGNLPAGTAVPTVSQLAGTAGGAQGAGSLPVGTPAGLTQRVSDGSGYARTDNPNDTGSTGSNDLISALLSQLFGGGGGNNAYNVVTTPLGYTQYQQTTPTSSSSSSDLAAILALLTALSNRSGSRGTLLSVLGG